MIGELVFRPIRPDEAEEAAEIEQICFSPNEASPAEHVIAMARTAPEYFLVAVDEENGKIAGFLSSMATDENRFRDEFFTDETLHNPAGKTVMILGLDVRPEYRKKGVARELMRRTVENARVRGDARLVLTCVKEKVPMYQKMGYTDLGLSDSVWGGTVWVEMEYNLV